MQKKHKNMENSFNNLMFNIFQQKINFKTNESKWEKLALKDVGKIITGNTPSTKNKEYYGELYKWITPSDITSSKFVENSERMLTEKGFKKSRWVPENSILVTCIASIGKNCLTSEITSFNQQINGIIPYEGYCSEFIYYLMEYNSERLKKFAGITATPILNKNSFSKLKFDFPTYEEQIKISKTLSLYDKKLDLTSKNINLLNTYKKGLLQKMFV